MMNSSVVSLGSELVINLINTQRSGHGSPVFSVMEAWSVFLSFLKTTLPNCRHAETTLSMAAKERVIFTMEDHATSV